jgi:hypothetical protein
MSRGARQVRAFTARAPHLPARTGILAAAALFALASPAPAADATLQASAGLGGVAKPGRWMPVLVSVTSSGGELAGDLTLEWGDVRLRRTLSLASPGTRTFELYVRTGEPSAVLHVRLRASGTELARADIPVRVLAPDEPAVVCVTSRSPGAITDPSCTASTTLDALPSSPRGYEVADAVVWPDVGGGTGAPPDSLGRRMTAGQRMALAQWQALRRLDATGDLSLAPQAARPTLARGLPASTALALGAGVLAYLACVLVAGIRLGARGPRTSRAYGAVALTLAAATAAALLVGRVGPARAVHVHHASLLQQIPDAGGSMLTSRGVVEYPAFSHYALRMPLTDATLEPAAASGRAEQAADADGRPLLEGTFGLAARQGFVVEGVTDVQPLRVAIDGRLVRVSNQMPVALTACRFGDGFVASGPERLEPGASAAAEWVGGGIGPMVTCTMPGLAAPFEAGDRPVTDVGSTIVAVYRPAAIPAGDGVHD